MDAPLITTKIAAPLRRGGGLKRSRLVEALAAADASLVLVVAPAGFGKSTLLAEYEDQSAAPFAWVFLDEADNDPLSLLRYIVGGIRRVVPDFGPSLDATMRGVTSPQLEPLVGRIVNELAAVDSPLVLVLEDFQTISEPACHGALAQIMKRPPPNVRFVISSRVDPPLPMGALRAGRALFELRAADLAFSIDETIELYKKILRLPLDRSLMEILHRRTEGWPAGLYLAYLSLRAAEDPEEMIRHFGGSNRNVADYFGQVVLDGLAAEDRGFLLDTSILDRMSGPLCDAVTERHGSSATLTRLESENRFLVPLDDHREWYRYHQLFAELLQDELARMHPELIPELHRRAGRWWATGDTATDAITHFVRGGDLDAAAGVVASSWVNTFLWGRIVTVMRWLELFSREYLLSDARLCLVEAWCCALAGRQEQAVQALVAAREAGYEGELADGTGTLDESIILVRASFLWGDVQGMLTAAAAAHRQSARRAPRWRMVAAVDYGSALVLAGRSLDARALLQRAIGLSRGQDAGFFLCNARGLLARIALELGDIDEAEAQLALAMQIAVTHGFDDLPWFGAFEVVQGQLFAAHGDLESAEREIARGADRMRGRWDPVRVADGLIALADVRRGLGRSDEARDLLDETRALMATARDPGAALAANVERVARHVGKRRRAVAVGALTNQELVVLTLLADGLTKREIAARLFVSYSTVHSHTKAIYRKLGRTSREEVIAAACELGLIEGAANRSARRPPLPVGSEADAQRLPTAGGVDRRPDPGADSRGAAAVDVPSPGGD